MTRGRACIDCARSPTRATEHQRARRHEVAERNPLAAAAERKRGSGSAGKRSNATASPAASKAATSPTTPHGKRSQRRHRPSSQRGGTDEPWNLLMLCSTAITTRSNATGPDRNRLRPPARTRNERGGAGETKSLCPPRLSAASRRKIWGKSWGSKIDRGSRAQDPTIRSNWHPGNCSSRLLIVRAGSASTGLRIGLRRHHRPEAIERASATSDAAATASKRLLESSCPPTPSPISPGARHQLTAVSQPQERANCLVEPAGSHE